MLAALSKGAVLVIEPTPQVEADGLALLKPAEAVVLAAGLKFKLASDHPVVEAFDQRDPDRDKPLEAILKVDQVGFVQAINVRAVPGSPEVHVEKIESYFWESREENGDVYPCFRVRWTVTGPFPGESKTLGAFSFGLKYSELTRSSEKRDALRARGAAAAYQAATYKLAVALQKLLVAE
ncbi:MAG: hypothetical protein ACREFX_13335 [Opitutaceae bacterium]